MTTTNEVESKNLQQPVLHNLINTAKHLVEFSKRLGMSTDQTSVLLEGKQWDIAAKECERSMNSSILLFVNQMKIHGISFVRMNDTTKDSA